MGESFQIVPVSEFDLADALSLESPPPRSVAKQLERVLAALVNVESREPTRAELLVATTAVAKRSRAKLEHTKGRGWADYSLRREGGRRVLVVSAKVDSYYCLGNDYELLRMCADEIAKLVGPQVTFSHYGLANTEALYVAAGPTEVKPRTRPAPSRSQRKGRSRSKASPRPAARR